MMAPVMPRGGCVLTTITSKVKWWRKFFPSHILLFLAIFLIFREWIERGRESDLGDPLYITLIVECEYANLIQLYERIRHTFWKVHRVAISVIFLRGRDGGRIVLAYLKLTETARSDITLADVNFTLGDLIYNHNGAYMLVFQLDSLYVWKNNVLWFEFVYHTLVKVSKVNIRMHGSNVLHSTIFGTRYTSTRTKVLSILMYEYLSKTLSKRVCCCTFQSSSQ